MARDTHVPDTPDEPQRVLRNPEAFERLAVVDRVVPYQGVGADYSVILDQQITSTDEVRVAYLSGLRSAWEWVDEYRAPDPSEHSFVLLRLRADAADAADHLGLV